MFDMYVCMHKHARLGGSGDMLPPGKFYKLDALRLLLGPFWDRSRAVVATWLSRYAFKPADFEFPREKVLKLAEQQVR